MDVLTEAQRQRCMSAVGNRDTKPEMIVRRMVHSLGYRFRLHRRNLPGCPDLVFATRRKVIFAHGCFWHRHTCSKGMSMPSTHAEFWRCKLEANRSRDERNRRKLLELGWKSLVIWECQTNPSKSEYLKNKICRFLEE